MGLDPVQENNGMGLQGLFLAENRGIVRPLPARTCPAVPEARAQTVSWVMSRWDSRAALRAWTVPWTTGTMPASPRLPTVTATLAPGPMGGMDLFLSGRTPVQRRFFRVTDHRLVQGLGHGNQGGIYAVHSDMDHFLKKSP